jgi:hypothetical protein
MLSRNTDKIEIQCICWFYSQGMCYGRKFLVYPSGNAMPVHPVNHTQVAVAMGLQLGSHWVINGLPKFH